MADRYDVESAIAEMRRKNVPTADFLLYGVKHGLLPPEWVKDLADGYSLGRSKCNTPALEN